MGRDGGRRGLAPSAGDRRSTAPSNRGHGATLSRRPRFGRGSLQRFFERLPFGVKCSCRFSIGSGDRVQCCAVLTGSGRLSPTLEATLASHAAIHTAEGEFVCEIVTHAAESCGLRVRRIKEKELFDLASSEFRISVADLIRGLNDLGKMTGPPWRQDHKFAALAGWLVL